MTRTKQIPGLLAWLLLSFVAAGLGAIASVHGQLLPAVGPAFLGAAHRSRPGIARAGR
jgi:hypothetical protein